MARVPMSLNQTNDPDILVHRRHGSLVMKAVGVPILVMGIAALNSLITGGPKGAGFELPIALGIGLIGTICVVFGSLLVFGSTCVRLDRRRRTLETWLGLFVPIRKKVFDISDCESVSVVPESRQRTGQIEGTYEYYEVFVVYLKGREKAFVQEFNQHPEAKSLAEQIAPFLNIPLNDACDIGHETHVR